MAERVLMKGNEAIAEAAIRAGCRHYFGYPITPQTEIAAQLQGKLEPVLPMKLQEKYFDLPSQKPGNRPLWG